MTESEEPRITVYGATGHTGRLVCRELARRGADFVAAGRNFEKLQHLSVRLGEAFGCVPTLRAADVGDRASLDSMLDRTNVLINCAGPFTELGPPVVEAAVRNGTHYLDTTGEQSYLRWIKEEVAEGAADEEVVVLPCCAYEYATGMMAADLAVEQGASRVVVCYAVSDFSTSPGTKKSIVRSIASGGVGYAGGRLVERRPAERVYEVPLPNRKHRSGLWFPGGEAILLPELAEVDLAESCLMVDDWVGGLLPKMSGVLSGLANTLRPVTDRMIDWTSRREGEEPWETETPFEVIAFDPETDEWQAVLSGYEPYHTTARLIVEAASRLDQRSELSYGLQSPPALFDTREFAEAVDVEIQTP